MRITAILPILTLAAIVTGCEQTPDQKATREYNVMILKPTDRELSSSFSATIRGKQDIDIRPKVGGYITEIHVSEGVYVKKGQPLFIIDQIPYEAALQTAKANVAVAEAAVEAAQLTLDSKEELYKQNIISAYDFHMARTTLAKQKATLAQTQANEVNAANNLSYTVVKSPADGVIGTLPFRVGTLVSPNDATPLTSVSDNSEMYVYFSMSESQVLSLTRKHGSLEKAIRGMPELQLELSDGTLYDQTGRIETISGIIDQTTGAISVRAKFPNSGRLLLSGGSGNVILPHQATNCLVIPQAATFEVQDQTYAFRYENGVAKSKIIKVLEISDGKEYVINGGVSQGDTIIVEGAGLIKDGTKVKIKKIVEGAK